MARTRRRPGADRAISRRGTPRAASGRRAQLAHRPQAPKSLLTVGLVVCALAPLGAGGWDRLAAQEVRGRVSVAGGLDQPVEAALVSLVDSAGERIDAAFTNPAGFFLVRAAAPGRHTVRVARIGFEDWTSEQLTLSAGESRTVELELPIRPVRLANIDVSVYRDCVEGPREARELEMVWDEARKALETAELAQERRLFGFGSLVFDRLVTRRNQEVIRARTFAFDGVGKTPFRSLEAWRLSQDGYIQAEGDTIYYYAPDATVLLSDTFHADHCFGLDREERDGRRLVGLTFEPRDGRTLPDIAGVLWLDEETAELERIDYRYENIPYEGADDRRIGGRIEFVRLPIGAFVVGDWYIRMPVLGARPGRDLYDVLEFTEYGGELRSVYEPEGEVIEWRRGGTVDGIVHDTFSGEPLADATLILDRPRGDDLTGHTGPDGTFMFHGLDPGRHRIRLAHPIYPIIGARPPRHDFELGPDERYALSFSLPDPERTHEDLCGRRAPGRVSVVGRAVEEGTLFPLERARIWALWTEEVTDALTGTATREPVISDNARHELGGRFVLCDLPAGNEVILQIETRDGRQDALRRVLDRPVTIVTFVLPPSRE